jgi:hypothetical protein
MKKVALLTLALIVAASTAAVAAVHVVGGAGGSANTFPFRGNTTGHRWQQIWFQNQINEAGAITLVEFQRHPSYSGNGGTYQNGDVLLCHTTLSAITNTYATNYGGKTPVTIFHGVISIPAGAGGAWFTVVGGISNFNYNNVNNLLIEVSWASGTTATNFMNYTSGGQPGRIYAQSKTATTGSITSGYGHIGRITIEPTGVAPTSLGRVKALYE